MWWTPIVSAVVGTAIILSAATGVSAADERDAVAQLRRLVPPALKGTCERLRLADSDVRVAGATGALVCTPDGAIEDVGLYLFGNRFDLGYWWEQRMSMLDEPLATGDCSEGIVGIEATPAGRVACYRTRGVARIRWFDEKRKLYGSVDGTGRNIKDLFDWWAQNVARSAAPDEALMAPAPGPLVTWQRVQTAPGMGLAVLYAPPGPRASAVATSAQGDSVVVGDELEAPLAWHSDDGLRWSAVDMPGSQYGCRTCTPRSLRDPGAPIDVVALGEGFVAIGNTVDEPSSVDGTEWRPYGLVWTSAGGTRWSDPQEIPDVRFEQLHVTPEGLAILGQADPRTQGSGRGIPTLWTSADGTGWTAQTIDQRPGRALELARSPSGVWLVRGSRLWRSTGDGSWVELALPEADADGRKLRFSGPAWTPSGFVLAVTTAGRVDGRRHGELWHSEDGMVWTVVAESTSPIGALASGPTGSFAFTMPPSNPTTGFLRPVPPVVLTSEDGRSWCSAEHAAFENASIQDGDVGPQGRVVAVGYSEHVNGAALIWRGVPADVEQTPCQAASPSSEAPASITLDQVPS